MSSSNQHRIDVDKLRILNVTSTFQLELQSCFSVLAHNFPDDLEEIWTAFRNHINEAAGKILGHKRTKKDFISKETEYNRAQKSGQTQRTQERVKKVELHKAKATSKVGTMEPFTKPSGLSL